MNTALFFHEACLGHETGRGHPECPDRLAAVMRALEAERFHFLDRRTAPAATPEQVARVHDAAYVTALLDTIPEQGLAFLDADTIVSPGSGRAALHAAGAVCAAVDAVVGGEVRNAFCAVRPPGHHAEPTQAMGFCLFNNVAVGAAQARAVHGLRRVAVVDFDVHHGNGTQAAFADDPDLLYVSTHQWPLYPGTGDADERGCSGNIVNLPLPPGTGSEGFRAAFTTEGLPALDRFGPELIMVSAGFDAHWRDPLAGLELVEDDYRWITEALADRARHLCGGRLVSTLEGGYDLEALGRSAAAHVAALMEG